MSFLFTASVFFFVCVCQGSVVFHQTKYRPPPRGNIGRLNFVPHSRWGDRDFELGSNYQVKASIAKKLREAESAAELFSVIAPTDSRLCNPTLISTLRNISSEQNQQEKNALALLEESCANVATFHKTVLGSRVFGTKVKLSFLPSDPAKAISPEEAKDINNIVKVARKSSCKPRNTIVDLPPAPLGRYYYPSCATVKRCSGCCDTKSLQCVPTELGNIKKKVIVFELSSTGGLVYSRTNAVSMEQHKKCSCECKIQKHHCSSEQEYDPDGCRCFCRNESEREDCRSPHQWNNTSCSCHCPETLCSTGTYTDPVTCRCVPRQDIERGKISLF